MPQRGHVNASPAACLAPQLTQISPMMLEISFGFVPDIIATVWRNL